MTTFQEIKSSLRQLYVEDERPWLFCRDPANGMLDAIHIDSGGKN
jgi:hypothetical protein